MCAISGPPAGTGEVEHYVIGPPKGEEHCFGASPQAL